MKSILTLFFLFLTISLSSQSSKGNWYFEGTTNAGYQRNVGKNTPDNSSFSVSSFRMGNFFTDRLIVGARVSFLTYGDQGFVEGRTSLQLRPFARLYFPGKGKRPVRFFGEGGFGTFTLFAGADEYETDFHLGGGAEISLRPGILGTANLRYDANASGLNYTSLSFGLNVQTGQLENAGSAVSLTAGTFMMHARLGSVQYGRMSSNGNVEQSTNIGLSPWAGYFITNRLMLEGGLGIYLGKYSNEIEDINLGANSSSYVSTGLNLNVRYYIRPNGKLLPYLIAGGGFSLSTTKFSNSFGENTSTRQVVPLRAGIGANYFLSPNLALDAVIMYDRWSQVDQLQRADFATRKAIGLDLGFRFFLPGT